MTQIPDANPYKFFSPASTHTQRFHCIGMYLSGYRRRRKRDSLGDFADYFVASLLYIPGTLPVFAFATIVLIPFHISSE
jgi:hypothetical protein